MKRKQVWRYWCDYCGKAGLSAGHMKKHERHCTMNPERECRMCKHAGQNGQSLSLLVEMARQHTPTEEGAKTLAWELEQEAGNCPICVYAAIRQAGRLATERVVVSRDEFGCVKEERIAQYGIPFDFKAKAKEMFDDGRAYMAGEL